MSTFNQHSTTLLKRAIDKGITSPAELANLMGQAAVESMNFHRVNESMMYSSADRALSQIKGLGSRHTREEVDAALATRDPETIANLLYDTHPTLGNREPGDGWRFHGRGVIQLTGRSNYEKFGRLVGVDLVEHPHLASEPDVSADVAIAYWKERCRDIDPTDVRAATKAINGGSNGYAERVAAVNQWSTVITPELVEGIRNQTIGTEDLMAMNASHHAPASSTLREGARGDRVRELQTQLHDLGYALRPDGAYGNATRLAVMAFQQNHDLVVDGIAGVRTLDQATTAHETLMQNRGPYVSAPDRPDGNVTRQTSTHDMFEALCRSGAEGDVDALCRVGRIYGETLDGQTWLLQGERSNQQALTDSLPVQPAAEQAPTQVAEQSAPAMAL
ncbi:peptidoglycan-binding protein [Luteibacter sp. 22Crub2.1]|uniref:peptidoglycan-binding protein n=1 Tax=Luteibacter sp. 22Crub2.1 TaxID=1283288 RepID=UPI0009A79954|nr:peptidoglycan-binding protein [Luteibacter sp. 22Crub2.1]SKC05494.1 putative chitinase [Luteibacter sp. 22Crub2.1]